MAIFACKACRSGFVSVLERQRAFLEDRCHHTVVWQRFCRTEFTFRPCPLLEKPKSVLQLLSIRQQLSQQTLYHIALNSITVTAANNFWLTFIQPMCLLVIDFGLGYSAYSSSFIRLCTNLHAQH